VLNYKVNMRSCIWFGDIIPAMAWIISSSVNFVLLKELEHSKLGWKVLISKYDLGNSLSKEMECKMADI